MHALNLDPAHHERCALHPPSRHVSLTEQLRHGAAADDDALAAAVVSVAIAQPDGVAVAVAVGKHAGQS